MSLKYSLTPRKIAVGKNKGKTMLVPLSSHRELMSFDRLCAEVADDSTVGEADVHAVLIRLSKVIKRRIEEGDSVDCGPLGSFRPSFGGVAVEKIEEFNPAKHIKKPVIRFFPRKAFADLQNVSFERVEAKYSKDKNTPNPGGGGTGGGSTPGAGV